MATKEHSDDILFILEDCTLCKFIELICKFFVLPPNILKFKTPPKQILKLSPTGTFPILKSGDDFISGTLPILNYIIKTAKVDEDDFMPDIKIILLGKNLKEEAKVEMQLSYIQNSVLPIITEIESQLYGKKQFNEGIFNEAINDLIDVLKTFNEQLRFNTFLTSNFIQLGDLMLTSVLFKCYNDIFTKDIIEKIPNIIRMFKFVSHLDYFEELFGTSKQCEKRMTPLPYVPKTEKKEEEKKEEKKEEQKEEKKDGNNMEKNEEKQGKKKKKKGQKEEKNEEQKEEKK